MWTKPVIELTKEVVPIEKARELLFKQMRPQLDKNGLIIYPGAIKRRPDGSEEQARSRHDEAPPLDYDAGIKLMFNLHMAPFKVGAGNGEAVPESDTFIIYARNGKSVGKVNEPTVHCPPVAATRS